jgi:hypothetical protein
MEPMKQRREALYVNPKIEVAASDFHGYGVFANRDIEAGEVLEECPVLILPLESDALFDYRFRWPKSVEPRGYAIPLGSGSIYNHQDDPNADWESDETRRLFVYRAVRDIPAGAEIFISYNFGEDYWANRPHLTKRRESEPRHPPDAPPKAPLRMAPAGEPSAPRPGSEPAPTDRTH